MTTFLWIGVFAANYTIISLVWCLMSLGRKNQPSRWFDYLLCWPVMGIFMAFHWMDRTITMALPNRKK